MDLHARAGRQLAALGDPADLKPARHRHTKRSPAAMPGFLFVACGVAFSRSRCGSRYEPCGVCTRMIVALIRRDAADAAVARERGEALAERVEAAVFRAALVLAHSSAWRTARRRPASTTLGVGDERETEGSGEGEKAHDISLPAGGRASCAMEGRAADAAAVMIWSRRADAARFKRRAAIVRPCRGAARLRSSPHKKVEETDGDQARAVRCRRGGSRRNSFTGVVWQDPIIEAPAPARIRAGRVSFEPGARTAWHTHPLGQTLHVISGVGRVQAKGGPIREIKAGRHGVDSAGREALARRRAEHRHGAYRDAGGARRQARRVDGTGD